MTEKKKTGGQPGPRGPYKPKPPTAPIPQYRIPLAHAQEISRRGGDWFRAVIAEACKSP